MACPAMSEFLGKGNEFASEWLKVSNLEELEDVFKRMYTLNTLPYFIPSCIYMMLFIKC